MIFFDLFLACGLVNQFNKLMKLNVIKLKKLFMLVFMGLVRKSKNRIRNSKNSCKFLNKIFVSFIKNDIRNTSYLHFSEGANSLSVQLKVSVDEAKNLMENFFYKFPKIKSFMADTISRFFLIK